MRRHAMKTVQDYLASAPHLFQVMLGDDCDDDDGNDNDNECHPL